MLENFDPSQFLYELFIRIGMTKAVAVLLRTVIIVLIVLILSWLANRLARFIIDRIVAVVVRRTKFEWDDIFLESKVFRNLSHIAPAMVIWSMAGWALGDYPKWLDFVRELTYLYMILAFTVVVNSFINAWHEIYKRLPISTHRPITGYIQVLKIVVVSVVALIIVAVVFDQKIGKILTGLGAMAAVLILVFQDTLLGLVASIQLSANKMVKPGDWISIPSRGVDGTVMDITLYTVKVRNFDQTIMTIPTNSLMKESFQNWTGMEQSGGRRIKRAINIDMQSVRFLDDNMKERFRKIEILRDYIDLKDNEIDAYNKEHNIDDTILVNGRRMTNLGTFRAYLGEYLRRHPKIKQDMTFLIRHLNPGETGLPVEIYVFSADQEWAKYESLQADIFDHILAVLPEFELRVFQNPTGSDFRKLTSVAES
jgi:miniconductance mechanosensitive channel